MVVVDLFHQDIKQYREKGERGGKKSVQFDYNFTEGNEEGLNYTQHGGILFPNGEGG